MYRPGFLNGVQSVCRLPEDTKRRSSQTSRNRISESSQSHQQLKLSCFAFQAHDIQESRALQLHKNLEKQENSLVFGQTETFECGRSDLNPHGL
jgi:hypothetical protein